jgi:glycosyltransferase involved in cell wall biosynthesis
MLGWEIPPYNSGGLGTASLGLTEGLAPLGYNITFVVPKIFGPLAYTHMQVLDATDYGTPADADSMADAIDEASVSHILGYGNRVSVDERRQLWVEYLAQGSIPIPPKVQAAWYARKATDIATKNPDFEVIHTHDWMTYHAGIAARQVAQEQGRNIPMVAHIHATEYDRCGEHGDPEIIAIEREGLRSADRVIAVSEYTKEIVHQRYGVPRHKISVVYNGIPSHKQPPRYDLAKLKEKHKIVLFMGRITMQKGPEYFVHLAKAVTDQDPSIRFVMVGSGDMERRCIEESAALGLTGKLLFSSFLRGADVDRAYQLADLFVMPSVSEPFGIVALEAMQNGTPALVSNQSGVAEVSENLMKVDFWDIEKMRDTVLSVLQSPHQQDNLRQAGFRDLTRLTWHDSARTLRTIYNEVVAEHKRLKPSQARLSIVPA